MLLKELFTMTGEGHTDETESFMTFLKGGDVTQMDQDKWNAYLDKFKLPCLGVFARLATLATLAAACRGRRLPLLPVTLAGSPLLPSEEELPANGDGSREALWLIAVNDLEAAQRLLDRHRGEVQRRLD